MQQKQFIWGLAVLLPLLLIIGLSIGPIMSQVEQPSYQVVQEFDDIQIRHYPPLLTAQVNMQGERSQAIGDAFRVLANYIFGSNVVEQQIAMTAPVQQTLADNSVKIAMTAPVLQQANTQSNQWQVSFVMPTQYTLQNIPKPIDARVQLIEVPARTVAAIRFSGVNSDDNLKTHEAQLLEFLRQRNIEPVSTPTYAFYNPPFTLPLLRRNEVLVEVVHAK